MPEVKGRVEVVSRFGDEHIMPGSRSSSGANAGGQTGYKCNHEMRKRIFLSFRYG